MVLTEISDVLSKRRAELIDMLENQAEELELEKQHQIYGAINEIDVFLNTIDFFQENSQEKDLGPIRLVKPPEDKKPFFSKLYDNVLKKNKKD